MDYVAEKELNAQSTCKVGTFDIFSAFYVQNRPLDPPWPYRNVYHFGSVLTLQHWITNDDEFMKLCGI